MTEARSEKLKKKVFWPQWIAGCGVWLLITELGLVGGWSSPYIDYLTSTESTFPVTLSEISWVVSLFNLGRFFGAVGGAICVNYVGSKTTITISIVPISLGWLFIILANSVEWLYVSRFCSGISLGMTYSCYSIYLGEIADPSIRGALMALGTSGVASGNFIMSVMGAYLSMTVSATIALVFCLLLMILFIWLPESPHHLIEKSLYEKAKSSIRWYHRDYDVESEFMDLRKFVENVSKQTLTESLRELKILHFRKSIIIVAILTTYAQLSGINNISFYMESIFTSAKVSVLEPAQVVIIVMACGIIGSCLSMLLMDRLGRRILMVISCTGIALSLSLLTVEFQLLDFGFDSKTVEGLAITGMIAFYITVFSGVTLLPPTMLGELIPPHLKCVAAFIISSTAAVISFISTVTYMPLLNFLNERYLFLFYGLLEATAIPFTLICVPETKGMSLQEIQDQLTGKSKA
ncbi:facilitated trehalose transporter Tret1-like [Bombus pyrosoma]|uniref:facilitated trehalose transporter Tret1-like n=1 Tax=Bombus pyrosoma TaxID=396416 RepID=UPI001CB8F8F7|nr:facilitated trehalose transporter Tret1-like [Bombus pyrosoma]